MSEVRPGTPTHHWDAYNARSLRDDEVVDRFVPPPFFEDLLSPQHQLVIGPRGSGKTTLLRMLQRNALSRWTHPAASRIRGALSFEGVFVPADRSWGEQFRFHSQDGGAAQGVDLLARATFTTHVLRSLVRTLVLLAENEGATAQTPQTFTRGAEEALSASFFRAWGLEAGLPSFKGVRQELRLRLSWLARVTRRLRRGEIQEGVLVGMDWIDLDFLVEVSNAVELVNEYVGGEGKRWALLFDELEVAPATIRESLMGSLRVPDTQLVLKLALSPYPTSDVVLPVERDFPSVPREGHDFDVVSLSRAQRTEVDRFGRQVLDSLVRGSPRIQSAPERLFGQSRISTPAAQWLVSGTAYSPDSKRMLELARYIKSDPGVLQYLDTHGVSIESVGLVKPERRAAHLRKIAPLVALREFYSLDAPGRPRRRFRQRKTYEFYSGLAMLLAVAEGNPRSILYLFGPMLEEAAASQSERVDVAVQSRAVAQLIATFRTLLKTIPAPTAGTFFAREERQRSARRGLLDFLDHVGEFFADSVYASDFSPDPAGSFVVDSHIPDAALLAIESAVNIGALVFVPDDDGMDYFGSAKGKRFRLSYLLAAYHMLPLRLGRSVSLSTVFARASRDQSGSRLFNEEADNRDG